MEKTVSGPTCPVCPAPRKPNQIFCPKHWFRVPVHLRNEIWASYAQGRPGHVELVKTAIKIVKDKLESEKPKGGD